MLLIVQQIKIYVLLLNNCGLWEVKKSLLTRTKHNMNDMLQTRAEKRVSYKTLETQKGML